MSEDPDLMKPTEAAGMLGVAAQTLVNQRSRGDGPPYIRLPNGHIRYSRKAVAAYLEAKTSWHATEEGRAHAAANAPKAAAKRWKHQETAAKPCEACGDLYVTPFPDRSRYCSEACSRRVKDDQGAYEERAACPVCGKDFGRNKYKHTPETCSRNCGATLRRQRSQEAAASESERVACVICDKPFWRNRGEVTPETCGTPCRARLRRQQKTPVAES